MVSVEDRLWTRLRRLRSDYELGLRSVLTWRPAHLLGSGALAGAP